MMAADTLHRNTQFGVRIYIKNHNKIRGMFSSQVAQSRHIFFFKAKGAQSTPEYLILQTPDYI